MKLTVFGATGRTGSLVVSQALALGHDVTAVVRDPAKLGLDDPALRVTTANVTSSDELSAVLSGQDAAISTLGVNSNKRAGIASAAARAIMPSAGRFIAVSAVPVDPTPNGEPLFVRKVVTPLLRTVLKDVYADLAQMEEEIRRSPVEWTIVRPPRLLDKPFTGQYRRELGRNVPNGTAISRADLAHSLLGMLTDQSTIRQIVGVAY